MRFSLTGHCATFVVFRIYSQGTERLCEWWVVRFFILESFHSCYPWPKMSICALKNYENNQNHFTLHIENYFASGRLLINWFKPSFYILWFNKTSVMFLSAFSRYIDRLLNKIITFMRENISTFRKLNSRFFEFVDQQSSSILTWGFNFDYWANSA